MKNNLLLKYIVIIVFFTLLYFFLLHSPILSEQKVLFYRGMLLLFLTTVLIGIILFIFRKKFQLSRESIFSAVIVSFAIHQSLFITLPVTFDRSFSMYLLNRLNNVRLTNSCPGIFKDKLQQNLIDEYFIGKHVLDKRLIEQKAIDFIKTKESCVYLTDKAKFFIKLTDLLKIIYGVSSL